MPYNDNKPAASDLSARPAFDHSCRLTDDDFEDTITFKRERELLDPAAQDAIEGRTKPVARSAFAAKLVADMLG